MAIVAMAWFGAPTTARAYEGPPVTDYVLPNASAVLNGTPISISGFYAAGGGGEWFASIQVTSSSIDSPYTGEYSWDYPYPTALGLNPLGGPITVSDGSKILQISVGTDLSLASVAITSGGMTVTDSAPTGAVVVTGHSIDYSFVNASTVLNGVSEAITGGFTYDPLTDIEYMAQVQLVGPAPYAGLYPFDAEHLGGGAGMEFGAGTQPAQISFANKLSSDADPLAEVDWSGGGGFVIDTAPKGVVCPSVASEVSCPAPVPEPASLALLSAALGLFFRRRAIGHAGQAQPEQPHGVEALLVALAPRPTSTRRASWHTLFRCRRSRRQRFARGDFARIPRNTPIRGDSG
jgi:hypothetical protein